MEKQQRIQFTFHQILELMVREAGLKSGHWGLSVRFGMKAANIGPSDDDLRPAAIVPILELGLVRAEKPSNLTVDAGKLADKSDGDDSNVQTAPKK